MIKPANFVKFSVLTLAAVGVAALATPVRAEMVLVAPTVNKAITLDGNTADWAGITGITVPLKGNGGVSSVEIKAVVHGDMIYMLAVWEDSSKDVLHKPYKWDEGSKSYKKTKQMEDRFAVSLAMSGDFSANKIGGNVFEADIWHWKAQRSNTVGLAHDKRWKIDTKPFKGAKKWTTPDGKTVYVARKSDKGGRLYKPKKYDVKQGDIMSRYEVNPNVKGSLADIKAKGVWKDGHWYLEMARKLDTGHPDDAVIPAAGSIKIAVAAFNHVDGRNHSSSEIIVLKTGAKKKLTKASAN